MKANTIKIILEDAFMITPKVKHFVFKAEIEPAFDFTPGQFITINFESDEKLLRRSYSIANSTKQNNRLEFAAGYVPKGPGTKLLFNLKKGDSVEIIGPVGRLIMKEEPPKRYIFVGTSTGITPYRAMINSLTTLLEKNKHLEVVIIQGVQFREDLLYPKDFLEFANKFENVSFHACLSREQSNLLPNEHKGHVQSIFPTLSLNPENDIIYLCGNPSMIDESFSELQELGFTTKEIIREKYISR